MESPEQLIARIVRNPAAVSDSDKLRSVADFLDVDDRKHGRTGTEVQNFLRGLALRLEIQP